MLSELGEPALDARARTPFRLGRRPELDGFRGVAVLLVVAYHATYFLLPTLAGRFVPGGFIGVDLFFVLSGFLITSLLLEELRATSRIHRGAFYRRRAWRLLPALYVFLIAQVVYTLIEGDPLRQDLQDVALIVLYVGNWSADVHLSVPFSLAQTWSLAIEEQFYLVWPVLLFGLARCSLRRGARILVTGIAVVAVVRLGLYSMHVAPSLLYSQTEARLDSLLMGALVAYGLASGWAPPRWLLRLVVPAFVVLVAVVTTGRATAGWLYLGGFTLVAGCAALHLLIVLEGGGRLARVLRARVLQACGRASYSLYLWHPFVFFAVSRALPPGAWVGRGVIGFGALAAVSTLSFTLIERPFRRGRTFDVAGVESVGLLAPGRCQKPRGDNTPQS